MFSLKFGHIDSLLHRHAGLSRADDVREGLPGPRFLAVGDQYLLGIGLAVLGVIVDGTTLEDDLWHAVASAAVVVWADLPGEADSESWEREVPDGHILLWRGGPHLVAKC